MKVTPLSLMIALAAFSACGKDQILYVDTPLESEETAASPDCVELNSDLAVLQTLALEAFSGGCVTSVAGTTISFDSGAVAAVALREAYGFDYINPVVSISGKYWAVGGVAQAAEVSSSLLQLQAENGSWYSTFDGGVTLSFIGDIESGSSVPVFSGFSAGPDEVKVTLGSGVTFSFEYLDEE